jgi:streptogramin lyase
MRNYKLSTNNDNYNNWFIDKIGIIGHLNYYGNIVKTYYSNSRSYGIKLFIKNKQDK